VDHRGWMDGVWARNNAVGEGFAEREFCSRKGPHRPGAQERLRGLDSGEEAAGSEQARSSAFSDTAGRRPRWGWMGWINPTHLRQMEQWWVRGGFAFRPAIMNVTESDEA
jgi:hypothetical protein